MVSLQLRLCLIILQAGASLRLRDLVVVFIFLYNVAASFCPVALSKLMVFSAYCALLMTKRYRPLVSE